MKELSIFIDESGDFGEYESHSPYYIISMVMHDQTVDISEDLDKLEQQMFHIGWPKHCIHAGPVIRSEYEYKDYDLEERQQVLKRLITFIRKIDIRLKSIYAEKKDKDSVELVGNLSKQLSLVIKDRLEYFLSFDVIKIYYDNGQTEVSKMLASVFSVLLDNVEFKKVIPSDYRLFQVADLVCTLKLAELKMNRHTLSKSERLFFKDDRTLRKNYLKIIKSKEL